MSDVLFASYGKAVTAANNQARMKFGAFLASAGYNTPESKVIVFEGKEGKRKVVRASNGETYHDVILTKPLSEELASGKIGIAQLSDCEIGEQDTDGGRNKFLCLYRPAGTGAVAIKASAFIGSKSQYTPTHTMSVKGFAPADLIS